MTVITHDFSAAYAVTTLIYTRCLYLLLLNFILLPYLFRKLLAEGLDPHDCCLLRFYAVLKLFILEF